jgi:hypothetical protein
MIVDNGSVSADGEDIGYYSFVTDTRVAVYDYRDGVGYVGTMSYEAMVDYFEDFESE